MYPLTEAILIENKRLHNIELHNKRFNNGLKEYLGLNKDIDLNEHIIIPEDISDERYKCRVKYSDGNIITEISLYEQRIIKSCKVVHNETIDYTYKTTDRTTLEYLFGQRGECDDIIIIKNGMVSDSFSANIIFFDGENWYTSDSPLLKGTQREFLLNQGIVKERNIKESDILKYCKLKLINAMLDFERAPEIKIPEGIIF